MSKCHNILTEEGRIALIHYYRGAQRICRVGHLKAIKDMHI